MGVNIETYLTQFFIIGGNLLFFFIYRKWHSDLFSCLQGYSLFALKRKKLLWEKEISHILMSSEMNFKKVSLPRFKFYSSLCLELLYEAQKTGLEYQNSLKELREQAQIDFQFSIGVLDFFWGVMGQFVFLALMTWGFLFAISKTFEESLSFELGILIGGLQLSGVILFWGGFHFLKVRGERKFAPYFSSLYFFKEFLKMNFPLQYLCEKSGVRKLLERRQGLKEIETPLRELISQILKQGGYGVGERFSLILSELRYLQSKDFEKTKNLIHILKMMVILLFFVPAYLLNLFSMIQKIL